MTPCEFPLNVGPFVNVPLYPPLISNQVVVPEYAAVAYLRPFATNDLARTGDSEKTQLIAEFTLEMRNEAAHGIVADLNPAL